jgi:hypothetical protein
VAQVFSSGEWHTPNVEIMQRFFSENRRGLFAMFNATKLVLGDAS